MPDFLQKFHDQTGAPTDEYPNGSPTFSNVRSGLIVALLSIGTLLGALIAAPIADKSMAGALSRAVSGASFVQLHTAWPDDDLAFAEPVSEQTQLIEAWVPLRLGA